VETAFDLIATLSPRERDVYALLCEGLSDREISTRLYIAPGTTKTHTHSILEKTGFKTRRALMLDAARRRHGQATSTNSDATGDSSSAES
jgi:DNA-binding NarL/FixJ family response regulator